MTDMRYVAGVELGGTKAIVLLAEGSHILQQQVLPTTTPEATLGAVSQQLRLWYAERPFEALGIGSFGPLRLDQTAPDFGKILATPKRGWAGADIVTSLAAPLDCPFAIDTDVNGAALAEHIWGAGAGSDSLCYITIGTGVGAGLVIDGRPVHGAMHPEIGHMVVRRARGDDFAGVCPFHGDCIEGLVSGPALRARFGMAGDKIEDSDPRWASVVTDLAQMVANVLLTTAARQVLIGGGVGMGRSGLLPMVQQEVVALLGGYLPHVTDATVADIVRAPALGADAGPLGAVALALRAAGD